MVSAPAKPPPMKTKVSALRRISSSVVESALSSCSRTWLRRPMASSMPFMPMPCSARPGIGKVRETAPMAMTR
ncbi:hypothetical protein SFUMM280S_10909 [Streptomyces fumanus]